MTAGRTIVFFPSPGAVGPTMNLIGIAQGLQELGHRPVFLLDPCLSGLARGFGLHEVLVSCLPQLAPEAFARLLAEFLRDALAAFRTSAYEQIESYVRTCLEATIESVRCSQETLPAVLARLKPDLIIKDNVALYPATEMAGCPWVRMISCCESELRDPAIPAYLSGCHEGDPRGSEDFMRRFTEVIHPVHERFNTLVRSTGHAPVPWPDFDSPSPYLNLLLYPEALRYRRRNPLDARTFQYLDGCIRSDGEPYVLPEFKRHSDRPLVYLTFGSMGVADVDLLKRMIGTLGRLPYRVLVNVGHLIGEYSEIPDNVQLAAWLQQTAVIPQCEVVIQHGGNNTLNETLYYGKRPIVMPFAWDGHDNAVRIDDTRHGVRLPRYEWTEPQLAGALESVLTDETINRNLARTSRHMQAQNGRARAARLIDDLLRTACAS